MKLDNGDWRERCGWFFGALMAPVTAAISATRHARMFHPDGVVYSANVSPLAWEPELQPLAERLAGIALVRFSSALWRGEHEWPDVLGVAVRFGLGTAAEQDLLLATIRFPWTMPFAPFATNFRSFLWNHYHAVSPFEIDGVGKVKFRLRSPRLARHGERSRAAQLESAARANQAKLELQVRRLEVPVTERRWQTLASLEMMTPVVVDQAALRFSPFHDGAGLQPVGFVHALRVATYAGSQSARPTHAPVAAE